MQERSSSQILLLVVVISAAVFVGACRRSVPTSTPDEDTLIRIGNEVVRVSQLQEEIDRMPPPWRSSLATPEARRGFVEQRIRNELLFQEALRLGYDQSPEVVASMKKAMIRKLVLSYTGEGPEADEGEITDKDIERYYREHANELKKPDEARVTEVVVKSRERALFLLERARRALLKARRNAGGALPKIEADIFRRFVLKHSEDEESRARGGDLTLVAGRGDQPPALVAAALALHKIGDLSDAPVETPKGFHILQLRHRAFSSTPTLEESKSQITRLLRFRHGQRKMDRLVATLSKRTKVDIFEDRIAKVRFDPPDQTSLLTPVSATSPTGPALMSTP
jgi:peptidyl-prolyl cis-trans isomerase C